MMTMTYPLPTLEGEATVVQLVLALWKTLQTWLQKRQDERDARDAFQAVRRLDDRMLADIGLIRADVEWAASLPLHINAAQALAERKRQL